MGSLHVNTSGYLAGAVEEGGPGSFRMKEHVTADSSSWKMDVEWLTWKARGR